MRWGAQEGLLLGFVRQDAIQICPINCALRFHINIHKEMLTTSLTSAETTVQMTSVMTESELTTGFETAQ